MVAFLLIFNASEEVKDYLNLAEFAYNNIYKTYKKFI